MAQALKKQTKMGVLYKRSPATEAAIDIAAMQDLSVLGQRATIRDRESSEYLPSECLVYLIRDAARRQDERTQNSLLQALLLRCMINLISKVDNNIADTDGLREAILSDFAELFAIDGSPADKLTLDYFEINFNCHAQAGH